MDDNLRILAMSVLTKETYEQFARGMFKMEYSLAYGIILDNLEDATDIVLETVYESTCDFVLFDHYRKSVDLKELFKSSQH